jgi:hypothetical protein
VSAAPFGRQAPRPVIVGGVKEFAIYTVLRLGLFVVCYAVIGLVWVGVVGKTGALVWPFIAALIVSSLLSFKFLAPQRDRFAALSAACA